MTPTGRVVQINVSGGGVPKLPVPVGKVTLAGLEGDSPSRTLRERQRNLKFHGGPDRALCLWSLEVIELLQREGHPIAPGSVGENLTLAGLDWASLVPGRQLYLGDRVQLQITDYAAPCRTIMKWFSDRRFSRIGQQHHPGSSRLYARVVQGGVVRPGDRATVEADWPAT